MQRQLFLEADPAGLPEVHNTGGVSLTNDTEETTQTRSCVTGQTVCHNRTPVLVGSHCRYKWWHHWIHLGLTAALSSHCWVQNTRRVFLDVLASYRCYFRAQTKYTTSQLQRPLVAMAPGSRTRHAASRQTAQEWLRHMTNSSRCWWQSDLCYNCNILCHWLLIDTETIFTAPSHNETINHLFSSPNTLFIYSWDLLKLVFYN